MSEEAGVTPIKTESDRDKANFWLQVSVAAAVIIYSGSMLIIVAAVTVPTKNEAAFNILLGNIMGWMGALIAFSFPNSIGSAKKDDTIAKQAQAITTTASTAAAVQTALGVSADGSSGSTDSTLGNGAVVTTTKTEIVPATEAKDVRDTNTDTDTDVSTSEPEPSPKPVEPGPDATDIGGDAPWFSPTASASGQPTSEPAQNNDAPSGADTTPADPARLG